MQRLTCSMAMSRLQSGVAALAVGATPLLQGAVGATPMLYGAVGVMGVMVAVGVIGAVGALGVMGTVGAVGAVSPTHGMGVFLSDRQENSE